MLKNLNLSHQGLILLLVPLIFEIAFVSALGWQMWKFDVLLRDVNQSRDFGATLDSMVESMYELSQDVDVIKSHLKTNSYADVPENMADVIAARLTALDDGVRKLDALSPNEDMRAKVRRLARPIVHGNHILRVIIDYYKQNGPLALYAVLKGKNGESGIGDKFIRSRDDLVTSLSELLKAKQEQQADYDSKIAEQERSFQRLLGIVIIGGAFHIMLALLLWVNFTRDTAYNFRILMDNTRRLAKGLPLNPPIEGAGEIAHLDRVFKDMAQALKETERMKQELVAMVSHDLRTPLTSIQGFLTLLSTGMYGELTQPGSENLSIAESNITRLISLINDLLDIEKMQSGKLEMELREVPLQDVFDRSYGSVIGFAEQQKVKLAMEPCDLLVYADGDRLVQVLVNLMSNAIKFSPKDAEVRVRAEERDDSVEIRVVDHGRGVPAAYREAIFERFQQVQKSDAKVKGGSGLGLAICKAIIEGHHGFIGVESEEGKGSTFWFRVPKPAAAQQAALVTTSTVDTTQ